MVHGNGFSKSNNRMIRIKIYMTLFLYMHRSADNKQLSTELSIHVQQMSPAFDHVLLAGLRLLGSSLSGSSGLPESSRREIIERLQEIVGYFSRVISD